MKLLICTFSTFLDVLLLNIFKFDINNISFFYPMFTIASITYISCFYNNASRKNYYFIVLLSAILYDTFAVGNLLITVFSFLFIAFVNIKMRKNFHNNLLNLIIRLLNDFIFLSLLVVIGYKSFNIYEVLYKVYNSIFINLLYVIIMFYVLKTKKI